MNITSFSSIVNYENKLYVVNIFNEGLYSVSINDAKMKCVTRNIVFTEDKDDVAHKIFECNGKIIKWCAGKNIGHLKIYDLENKTCKDISVFEGRQMLVVPYENQVICIDIMNKEIKKVDVTTATIYEYKMSIEKKDEVQIEINPVFYYSNNEHSVFCLTNFNSIIEFNLHNREIKTHKLDIKEKIEIISVRENYSYVWTNENTLYKYNFNNGELEMICSIDTLEQQDYSFSSILVTEEYIYLIPYREKNIYVLDKSGNRNIYNMYPKDIKFEDENYRFFDYSEDDKRYYLPMPTSNYFAIISKENSIIEWIKPVVQSRNEITSKVIAMEKGELKLKDFIMNII